uniref:Intraflagellar transport protein 172 n=1 Tax=Setaria digitata TaxID=48799 RepID=A0A915PPW5_9BILA
MRLKYLATILEQQDGAAKVPAIVWSPNGKKLAVANADRVILLFDETGKRRDKFATKPIDPRHGKKSYQVRALAFSPDSTRIAVGQTDNIVYVYRVGKLWDEKKVICNKFVQSAAVITLLWPNEERLIIGLMDGKVRAASCRSNKCSTLYRTNVSVISLAHPPNGGSFISGHSDGSIILYSMDQRTQTKILTHTCAPYALAYTGNSIIMGGCDQRVVSYAESGQVLQQFDYHNGSDHEKEFTVAARDSFGQSVIFGSFDRVRLYTWNSRRGALDEGKPLEIRYLYTISALAWSPDGSTIALGTLCGAVITVDCCLKRSMLKGRFQTKYVSPSQVLIKDTTGEQRVTIHSSSGLLINEIKIMGHDRFVVAYTTSTLIVADMITGYCSEIEWKSAGNERFCFDNENVCMIINAGEVNLVEYGNNKIIGWIRTELLSPHLISVRLTKRKIKNGDTIKCVAYLLDLNTISVVDLITQRQIAQFSHSVYIDWIELSEMATKLLFRDKRSRLLLADLKTDKKTSLLDYCSYVQWVPNSDVIVAQSSDQLCVWYQAENPDEMIMVPIKGEIETVLRDESRTEVIVEEANAKVAYELDQTLIEFASAIDRLDFGRAIDFLERRGEYDTGILWRQLAEVALSQQQLLIAQRCFAALGDISRVQMLVETIQIANEEAKKTGDDGKNNYKVQARLALMNKDFREVERIYLEQNALDELIEMYQQIGKWEEAFELARAQNHADLEALKTRYYRYLFDTGQDGKAAQISELDGDLLTAIDLYLKASLVVQAARILLQNPKLLAKDDLVQKVAAALIRSDLLEKFFFFWAGELFEAMKDFDQALANYRKGKGYAKAIQLARIHFPEKVIQLEEEWGDSLVAEASYDAAINHFLESGQTTKALEASIKAKQWGKAAQIVDVLEDNELAKRYYGKIADHHASIGDLERAEMLYIEAKMHREAIEMYNRATRWADSYRLAMEFMGEESEQMYNELAETMEDSGRLKDAEELYVAIGKVNKAIAMYKKTGRTDDVIRLMEKYDIDDVKETHLQIAADLAEKGDLRGAEEHYLLADDWKSAVNMYRNVELWNDAHRIARQEGGDTAQKQIAYLWAKSLNADAAVKLLQKFQLLNESIDYACENGAFDFAFDLCRLEAKDRLSSVHFKLAQQLEEEGEFEKAEMHYIESGKPREAILMYIHDQDWKNAERIAKEHNPEALSDVYMRQARTAIDQKDFTCAESCLLRANRPEVILRYYKESGMWQDAIRIAKDYMPAELQQLEEEFDEVQLKSGAKGISSFIAQGRDWETEGEYTRAIQCYLKIKDFATADTETIVQALKRAGELAIKFLSDDETSTVVDEVAENFIHLKKFIEAAELFLASNQPNNAVKAFLLGGQWAKAKKIALESVPDMVDFVDERYRESLKEEGRLGELMDIDVVSAIDAMLERGQWEKALEIAHQQKHQPLLNKYVALYATELIKESKYVEATAIFEKYGASANPSNFNIYQRLVEEVINARDMNNPNVYRRWSVLRNVLLMVHDSMHAKEEMKEMDIFQLFDRYLEIAHYGALRSAILEWEGAEIELIAAQITISFIRYSDIMQADKAFYEAGMACRKKGIKKERLAFTLLNYYLDLCDAIEDQDPSVVDGSIFEGTDVPQEVTLPAMKYTTDDEHEEVKEWVLAISVERSMERCLPYDTDGNFEVSLNDANGTFHQPCIISANSHDHIFVEGYPVRRNIKEFGSSGKVADRDTWSRFIMAQKTKSTENIGDVLQFIAKWTHTPTSLSL